MKRVALQKWIRTHTVRVVIITDNDDQSAILTIYFAHGKFEQQPWTHKAILRAALAHWRSLHGVALEINGVSIGVVSRYHPELCKGYFPRCPCHHKYRGIIKRTV